MQPWPSCGDKVNEYSITYSNPKSVWCFSQYIRHFQIITYQQINDNTKSLEDTTVTKLHLLKYNKSHILWYSALNRNAYFPYVSQSNSKTNNNKKNYNTALCDMLGSKISSSHCLVTFSQPYSTVRSLLQAASYFSKHYRESESHSCSPSCFQWPHIFFFSQVTVQHAPWDLTQTWFHTTERTWNIYLESNINNRHHNQPAFFKL
jgi:hypothetical protein